VTKTGYNDGVVTTQKARPASQTDHGSVNRVQEVIIASIEIQTGSGSHGTNPITLPSLD
jgi:hypothetical protein